MLGEALIDPQHIAGNMPGLGLLPLVTLFEAAKTVRHTRVTFAPLAGPWACLSGLAVDGYEIHTGRTAQHAGMPAGHVALPGGLGWQNTAGNVLGVYLHGLFEQPQVLQALFGAGVPTLDSVFERLADVVDQNFETGVLPALLSC
jgi:adenosylcobyric acid synthase